MPELPEVEVVRCGLETWAAGSTVVDVTVADERSLRRHSEGPVHFVENLRGARLLSAERRGKYLWLPLGEDRSLVAHLGMSGQLLINDEGDEPARHQRVTLTVRSDDGTRREVRFADQRLFGGLMLAPMVADGDHRVPVPVAHIARDPLDPRFDQAAVIARMRRRSTGIKRALLDQTLVSGIGNIYADEALWRSGLHYDRPTNVLSARVLGELLVHVAEVMSEALAQGGTSFDALYVNVNGASGYFSRSLNVYGQHGKPCARCGTLVVREPFMNRSSFRCPRCQRPPGRRGG